jgi:hypothetical protein
VFGSDAGSLFDFYVDSVNGSDSNDGLTAAAAFQSIEAAYTASESGDVIALKAGQYHLRRTNVSLADRSFGKYGSGDDPIIDARQHLQAATWTNTSGNVWQTDVTLGQTSVAGGTGSNTFNPGMWFNELFLDWKVGGADIAANISAVEAAVGSFTIHRTGQTQQDPRVSGQAGTAFTVYVHLPDSSDPNGQDVSVTSYQAVCNLQGGTLTNIVFKGGHGKDHVGIVSYSGDLPTFVNCSSIDFGEHGWVGPANVVGTWFARGKARPGVSGATLGRNGGAAFNAFTNVYRDTLDLSIENIDAADCAIAFYGHGSGNRGYRDITIGTLTVDNCTKIAVMNPVPTTLLSMCNGTVAIGDIQATDVDRAFEVDGVWTVGAGNISFAVTPLSTNTEDLAVFVGNEPTLTMTGVTWDFNMTGSAGFARNLSDRNTSSSFTDPVLILDGCTDASAAGIQGRLRRGGTANIFSKIALTVSGGSLIGDILDQATGTNYPVELTVEAGCTFGMGDRTGPAIEAALTAASIPYTISNDTTIVNRAGTVLSSPGW